MQTNPRLELARHIAEQTGTSLFLTGKAGTGKTTFLRNLQQQSRKRIVVTAPTGIAAINAGGVTLHSLFQLPFTPYIPGQPVQREKYRFSKEKLKIIRGMDMLVIDEVSMVRADLLDAVDDVLRRLRDRNKPFGGVQLLLIGDLQQLPPVVAPNEREIIEKYYKSSFFFDSNALKDIEYVTVELNEVFRQKDEDFLRILNAIRENRVDAALLDRLNARYKPHFNPDDNEGYIRLLTHNAQAAAINSRKLDELPTPDHLFTASIEGKFPENSYPAEYELRLKVGAQVMFIRNDSQWPRRYYNGMIGQVVAIDEKEGIAVRPEDSSEIITVEPAEWENVNYKIDTETNEVVTNKEGIFFQYPLRAAWAITIHKSQGLTFTRAIIDATRSFAHGQTYVALSRCRSLNGLVLSQPLSPAAIICDNTVNRYLSSHNCDNIDENKLDAMKRNYKIQLLDELFDFRRVFDAMEGIVRLYQENFNRQYGQMVDEWKECYNSSRERIVGVADKFRNQYVRLAMEGDASEEALQTRVKAAANYFASLLEPVFELSKRAIRSCDNKKTLHKLNDRLELFEALLTSKRFLTGAFRSQNFSTDMYLDLKARALLGEDNPCSTKKKKKVRKEHKPESKPMPTHIDESQCHGKRTDKDSAEHKAKQINYSVTGTPKKKSWETTLDMFKEGHSLDEIASQRGLAFSTVCGHIIDNATDSNIVASMVARINDKNRERLQRYFDSAEEIPSTLTEIRMAVGEEVRFDEIRLMMAHLGVKLSPPSVANEPETPYGSPADFLDDSMT